MVDTFEMPNYCRRCFSTMENVRGQPELAAVSDPTAIVELLSSIPKTEAPSGALTFRDRLSAWRDRTIASAAFQKWAARFPLTRPIALKRSRALFDVMAGFVYSQVLRACVELELLTGLASAPKTLAQLADHVQLPVDSVDRIVRAAVALQLLEWRSGQRVGLGSLGAVLAQNDGLLALVKHHGLLYEDLRDPVNLLRRRASTSTSLGRYYPYATEGAALESNAVTPYSQLMSVTAAPLIDEVLDAYSFALHLRVMDVGGGEGRFARALSARWPHLAVSVFDLPSVAERASLENARQGSRVTSLGGDFRADDLPRGADLITLIRVVLDHDDATVVALLRKARLALAPQGKLLIAEPMAGAKGAGTVGDAYFGLYLLAMGNGRARQQSELEALCLQAGFRRCTARRTRYPVSTGILIAEA